MPAALLLRSIVRNHVPRLGERREAPAIIQKYIADMSNDPPKRAGTIPNRKFE
jgi:hypothetical protein